METVVQNVNADFQRRHLSRIEDDELLRALNIRPAHTADEIHTTLKNANMVGFLVKDLRHQKVVLTKRTFEMDLSNLIALICNGLKGQCADFLKNVVDIIARVGFDQLHATASDDNWHVEAVEKKTHSKKNKLEMVVVKYLWQKKNDQNSALFWSNKKRAFHLEIVTARLKYHQPRNLVITDKGNNDDDDE